MVIVDPVIRPPAEAYSFLLQVTLGCSANQCSFCGAYINKGFSVKGYNEIAADINHHARWHRDTRRVFLLDGDALVVNNNKLLPILKMLEETFPKLSRISSYANGYNITRRSDNELSQMCECKLRLIYIGLESGSQDILNRCRKSSGVEEMIEAVHKAAKAQIKSSVMVLLGLGGKRHSEKHVQDTIKALNMMQPRYLSFLSLMIIPGTPLAEEAGRGDFEELNPLELLKELYEIIKGLKLNKTIFRSDHASNYLSLKGVFPKDKTQLLHILKSAINGDIRLRPEFSRGL